MISFIQKQWFLVGLGAAALLGYLKPEWGVVLKEFDLFRIGIFLSFLATGLSLETQAVFRQITAVKAPLVALLSSLVLYPLLAYAAARPLLPDEMAIGIAIIATAPVTVSSGTILTAVARGNVPLSLLICIFSNILAIFTIPILLDLLLGVGHRVELPVLRMLGSLAVTVLLPLILGQLLRPLLKLVVRRWGRQIAVFQSSIIILIIFNAVSSSTGSLGEMGAALPGVVLFTIGLHLAMLVINNRIARLIGLDRSSTIAFTIHTSQKTMAVSYLVWAGYFAADYPAAFVPAIICQLTQMTIGTMVADYFRRTNRRYPSTTK